MVLGKDREACADFRAPLPRRLRVAVVDDHDLAPAAFREPVQFRNDLLAGGAAGLGEDQQHLAPGEVVQRDLPPVRTRQREVRGAPAGLEALAPGRLGVVASSSASRQPRSPTDRSAPSSRKPRKRTTSHRMAVAISKAVVIGRLRCESAVGNAVNPRKDRSPGRG